MLQEMQMAGGGGNNIDLTSPDLQGTFTGLTSSNPKTFSVAQKPRAVFMHANNSAGYDYYMYCDDKFAFETGNNIFEDKTSTMSSYINVTSSSVTFYTSRLNAMAGMYAIYY